MADTFELFSLTSKLDLDTSAFDRGYTQSRSKMVTLSQDLKKIETGGKSLTGVMGRDLRSAFSGLQASVTGLGGPLDGTIGRYNNLLSVGSKLSLSTAGIGLGFGILATGAVAASVGMFALVKKAAEAGDEIFDLTQKVNFAAETISTLKNEGELAGVEFSNISTSLGIFNKNVEAVQEGDKKLSALFKALNIDLRDNESALRSTFRALMAVENGGQQTALAMQIFGKSGKEILGVIKSLNGDVDAATEKFRKMGSLITTESAKAANEFSDKLKILEQRFDGVTRAIGERLMPTATDALDKVSQALDENSRHAQTWADTLVGAVEFAAQQIKYILEGLATVIEGFQKTFGKGSLFERISEGGSVSMQDNLVNRMKRQGMLPGSLIDPNKQPEGEYAVPFGTYGPSAGTKPKGRISLGGGGGGRGGGGRARDLLEEQRRALEQGLRLTLSTMEAEQEGIERSYDQRRSKVEIYYRAISRLEETRHKEVLDTLEEERKLAEKIKDPAKRGDALADLALRKAEEANRHRRETWRLEDRVKDVTRERIVLVETLVERLSREREVMKQINQERSRFKSEVFRDDLGGGSGVLTPEVRDQTTRPRVATVDEQVRRERAAILREQMDRLASDLTFTIDDAITEGFRRGVKAGVIEFGLGILQMARHAALQELEKAISKALGGSAGQSQSSGGSGGLWSSIIKMGVSAVGALFGGGGGSGGLGSAAAGAIGGHAGGGYMPPNSWSWVGERGPELVKSGPQGASVMSNRASMAFAGSGSPTINVYAQDAQSFTSRRTQTQIKRMYQKLGRAA